MYYLKSSMCVNEAKIECVNKLFIHTENVIDDTICKLCLFCNCLNRLVEVFYRFNSTRNKIR